MRHLRILGTRGIPARHGGFETFAEKLAIHLTGRGWRVTVYCQEDGKGPVRESHWQGVRLIHVPVSGQGAAATLTFDWRAISHALNEEGLCLTLGYNTALFSLRHRLAGQVNVMNMDGFEWRREKWGLLARGWLRLNEYFGACCATALVADHPVIQQHFQLRFPRQRIAMIPYGADAPTESQRWVNWLRGQGIDPERPFGLVVARPVPENGILEIVTAFGADSRDATLVVLGTFSKSEPYHRQVRAAASSEVVFPGALYDQQVVGALRSQARVYFHGHRVGGTNPSLVEAMAAGSLIVAHDNRFNRWVLDDAGLYFNDSRDLSQLCAELFEAPADPGEQLRKRAFERYARQFRWEHVLSDYERVLLENAKDL